jgi:FkbM family methyltransferase
MIELVRDLQEWQFAVPVRDTHIGAWAKERRDLVVEPAVHSHICPLINDGDTVIDAGANIGDHTIAYASKVGRGGTVHAFEVNLLTAACLLINSRDTPQVNVHVAALGCDDYRILPVTADWKNYGASHISTGMGGDFFVKEVSLDSMNLRACHLIKLDIEGWEPAAIKGAMQTIIKFRPKIVIELNDGALARFGHTKQDILGPLSAIGYKVVMIDETHNLDMPQVDVILMP